jgi:cysteine desulfurase family protein (TIGR01976 family)
MMELDQVPECPALQDQKRYYFTYSHNFAKEEGMKPLDLAWVRGQFPALSQVVNGQPVVYLDGPGGTQVPGAVIDGISHYLTTANANVHGAFATSHRTDRIVSEARQAIADFLGCEAEEVVFGANMTTLTFAFSRAIGRALQPGDEIIVTQMDHDANIAPWMALAEQGIVVRMVPMQVEDCTVDLHYLATLLNKKTKLVAVGYASNAVGTLNPIAEIVQLAHAVGAWVFVDAVHYAPHGVLDVRALDCDFLVCSVYKFFGPHLGILYGKREHLAQLSPYKVKPASDAIPGRWETGTLNFEALAGTIATICYLAKLGHHLLPTVSHQRAALKAAMTAIQLHEQSLMAHLIPPLGEIPGVKVYGITDPAQFHQRTPTIALRIRGQTPAETAKILGDRGFYTWHGNFYALHLTQRLGVEATGGLLRIGFVHYNTLEEVNRLLTAIQEIAVEAASPVG